MPHNQANHSRIAIIGAGFGGIGTGIRLRERGQDDFVIFDKASGVGGTWWVNRYPGCACDVPSHLYSFSFAPNPDWTRRFAPRAEIQAYLERLADEHGLASHIHLDTEVVRAAWDDSRSQWRLTDHRAREWTADFLVSALGALSRPAWPDIPGLETFGGPLVHSQQWPDDLDLSGRKVAVIGTGATAAQLVPEIAKSARRVDVYQRTPAWILPRPDRPIAPRWRRAYRRWPGLQKLARFSIWAISEMRVPALLWVRAMAAGHRLLAHRLRHRQISDRELRRRLKPDYDIGCKRVILSSDFYPALERENVELVTTPIRHIESDAIVDEHGRRRSIDTLILATGFRATDPVPEGLITGRDGIDLARTWCNGPEAYKGTTIAGFPNLFTLLGPNTGLGHNSVVMMIESQINYVLAAIDFAGRTGLARLEVDAQAQTEWNRKLAERLSGSVWNDGGCRSWYLHPESGRNTTIWPGFTLGFRRRLSRFDEGAYKQTT